MAHQCTANVIKLESQFERFTALYRMTCLQYENEMLVWCKLYRRILLNKAQSISLERIYHIRKLYQTPISSNFDRENVSDRLVLHRNSPEPGSVEAVLLYIRAFSKWYQLKKIRFYSAVPLQDKEMRK